MGSSDFELLIIGGGRMGEALAAGLLSAGHSGIGVVEALPQRREELAATYDGLPVLAQPQATVGAVLAVKPADCQGAIKTLAERGCKRVLSVAAGVTSATLEAAAGSPIAVVRAMPNTPALIGAGVAAISPGSAAGADDLDWAESILGAVGEVVRVSESALDAVTGLAGSGPAYVFLAAEALVEAGVLNGLARPIAEKLAYQTLLGAARLLTEGHGEPAALRAAVTSPGGTTAAGLRELERHRVRAAFSDAVTAATERSRELGSS